jgi:CBS domain-containing protein
MKCKDIMTRNPTTCAATATAQAAALIMSEEDVGVVPVVDEQDRLMGVVTDRDLCLDVIAGGKNPQEIRIREVLHADLVTCRPEDDIERCLEQMKSHQIRRIPITDEDGRCVGIISQGDIALKVRQAEEVHDTVREISKSGAAHAA